MEMSMLLGILATLLQLLAYALYNRQIFAGQSKPNTTTLALWVYLSTLNASSYVVITSDVAKYLLPVITCIANTGTLLYSLYAGKLERIKGWNLVVLYTGIGAGAAWVVSGSALVANVIVLGAVFCSFLPIYGQLWKESDHREGLSPWVVWLMAYLLLTAVVYMRWHGQYEDLIYPVGSFMLHAVIIALAQRTGKKPLKTVSS